MSAVGPVLVTGATGFVGRRLVRRLLDDGRPVVALVRDRNAVTAAPGLTAVEIPGSDVELRALVADQAPAVCVHLATRFVASQDVDDLAGLIDANVLFGLRVASACLAGDAVPFVNTATVWQHAGGEAYAPLNLYAATKQALHDLLVELAGRGLPLATLTLTDTYGPDDPRPKLVPRLVEAARTGEVLPMGDGLGRVDLVHVDDVVAGFCTLIDRLTDPAGPMRPEPDGSTAYTLTSGAPHTVREVVEHADRALGRPVPVEWGARPGRAVDQRSAAPFDPPLPGWRPSITLDEGLTMLFAPLRASDGPAPADNDLAASPAPDDL